MKRYDLIVVGAGPSGLSAAIEAAKRGLKVVVFDENLGVSYSNRFINFLARKNIKQRLGDL